MLRCGLPCLALRLGQSDMMNSVLAGEPLEPASKRPRVGVLTAVELSKAVCPRVPRVTRLLSREALISAMGCQARSAFLVQAQAALPNVTAFSMCQCRLGVPVDGTRAGAVCGWVACAAARH